jgi:hypothetical protein
VERGQEADHPVGAVEIEDGIKIAHVGEQVFVRKRDGLGQVFRAAGEEYDRLVADFCAGQTVKSEPQINRRKNPVEGGDLAVKVFEKHEAFFKFGEIRAGGLEFFNEFARV